MSTIDEIREQSKTVWAVSAVPRTGSHAAENSFSAMLANMRAGKPAGGGESSASSAESSSSTAATPAPAPSTTSSSSSSGSGGD